MSQFVGHVSESLQACCVGSQFSSTRVTPVQQGLERLDIAPSSREPSEFLEGHGSASYQVKQKGDIKVDANGKRRRYNGSQWRLMCQYPHAKCPKEAQSNGLCSRHNRETRQDKKSREKAVQNVRKRLSNTLESATDEDSCGSFAMVSTKRSHSTASEVSTDMSPVHSEPVLEAAQGLVSLKSSRTSTPYVFTPMTSPDMHQDVRELSQINPHSTHGLVGIRSGSAKCHPGPGSFQRHASQGSLLEEGIHLHPANSPLLDPVRQYYKDEKEPEAPPEDVELTCQENCDSAFPEDFPSKSESMITNATSSTEHLFGTPEDAQMEIGNAEGISESYTDLPPCKIVRMQTQSRQNLEKEASKFYRSNSLPDIFSNIYQFTAIEEKSMCVPLVKFIEKPLQPAHQPKVCTTSASLVKDIPKHKKRSSFSKSDQSAFISPQRNQDHTDVYISNSTETGEDASTTKKTHLPKLGLLAHNHISTSQPLHISATTLTPPYTPNSMQPGYPSLPTLPISGSYIGNQPKPIKPKCPLPTDPPKPLDLERPTKRKRQKITEKTEATGTKVLSCRSTYRDNNREWCSNCKKKKNGCIRLKN